MNSKKPVDETIDSLEDHTRTTSSLPLIWSLLSRLSTAPERYRKLVEMASLTKLKDWPSLTDWDLSRGLNRDTCTTLPCWTVNGNAVLDLRFAKTATGERFVPESQQILQLEGVLPLLAATGSGKTRAIFDAARQKYTIYVS